MTPEQNLVQQISQLLASNQLENRVLLQDYAEQLADICQAAHDRLVRCIDYLDKGRRSEAVFEAHVAPDLLELSALLSQPGLKRWHNVCIDLELPQAQSLEEGQLSRLREECGKESSLEPLLKEYRRYVYQSDHASCIRILRKIREQDPDNQGWIENLRPLEEAFLGSWIARAEKGLASMDLADLTIVFNELNDPQRVVKAPEELMKQLRKALLSERSGDLLLEGEVLVAKLQTAMQQEDTAELERLWKQCERLEADESFMKRPDNWEGVLAKSHNLAEQIAARKARQADFDAAVSHIRDLLMDDKVSTLELRHEWERLETWQMPIPELLTKQVNEVLAARQAARRKRATMMTVGISVAVVVIVGLICVMLIRHQAEQRRSSYLAEAETLFKGGDYEALQRLMDEIKDKDAQLFTHADLQGMRDSMAKAQQATEDRRRQFAVLEKTLNEIRESNYAGDDDAIRRTLEDATAVAVDKPSQDFLLRWKNDWLRYAALREQQLDDEILPLLNGVQTQLDGVKVANRDGLSSEMEGLQAVATAFGKINALQVVKGSQQLRDQYAKLKGTIQSRLTDVQRRKDEWTAEEARNKEQLMQQHAQLERLRKQIHAAYPNLELVGALLTEFVKIGGDRAPESTDFKQLLSHWDEYKSVSLLQKFTAGDDLTGSEVYGQVNASLAEDNPLSSSVWRSDLSRVKGILDMDNRLRQQCAMLMNLKKDKMFVLRYRKYGDKDWLKLYSPKRFQTQVKDGITIYWGETLWANANESRLRPTGTAQLFGDKNMTTRDFEFLYARDDEDNMAEHIVVLKRLVMESTRSKDVLALMLTEIDGIRSNAEINPVQGMLLAKRLLNMLPRYCLDELPECQDWARKANEVQTDVPWTNERHPKTVEALEQISHFWEQLPSLELYVKRLAWNRQLLSAVLRSGVRCVGSIQADNDGKKVFYPCEQAPEYWMFVSAGDGAPAQFRRLPQAENGALAVALLRSDCLTGMPVYAPRDGRELQRLLTRLAAEEDAIRHGVRLPQTVPLKYLP